MTQDSVMSLMQLALKTVILTSAPPLVIGLVVGLAMSIFQTVTSIQEQTLAFVPKVLAVFVAIILFGSYMMTNIQELFIKLFTDFTIYLH